MFRLEWNSALLCPAPNRRGHKAMMLPDVSLSVTYIGPKSKTERPRKTKIGTEVAEYWLLNECCVVIHNNCCVINISVLFNIVKCSA